MLIKSMNLVSPKGARKQFQAFNFEFHTFIQQRRENKAKK
ncbi:hypothetical protein GXM_02928 [Nostoc sphaeroides CCNUC1]|uniref:Uncharacterized protein n=1 Tax=Nostoc sphaeroides CCNUC1 TaxID=2653204 RepID=A0A5P8VYQ6_9NOSO|nr:hypothetical protein GXM_02928 [Nostoc sphaeroides CCNUC1]